MFVFFLIFLWLLRMRLPYLKGLFIYLIVDTILSTVDLTEACKLQESRNFVHWLGLVNK